MGTQVGGIWLEEDKEKHDKHGATGTTIGEKVHHAVEAGEKFFDKMLHGSRGSAAPSTVGPNPARIVQQVPFAARVPVVNTQPLGVPATYAQVHFPKVVNMPTTPDKLSSS